MVEWSRMKSWPSKSDSNNVAMMHIRNWRKVGFWRDLFLYFWLFSLVGHAIELAWALLGTLFTIKSAGHFASIPIFAIAAPYGLGAVALLLFIYPMVKRKKLGLVSAYVVSVAITTVIEFVSALLVVLVLGSNPFWDYSDRLLNLFGFVCLGNSLLFGIISVVAIRWLFPWTEKWRRVIGEKYLNLAFLILFPAYMIVQLFRFM